MRNLFRSPAFRIAAVLFVAVIYSVVGTASHKDVGHQQNIPLDIPHYLSSFWMDNDNPAKIVKGGQLTVSVYQSFFYDWEEAEGYMDLAIDRWNFVLAASPAAFGQLPLVLIGDSTSADIEVKPGQCSGSSAACSGAVIDDGSTDITIAINSWDQQTDLYQEQLMAHELGHAFGHLRDHYPDSNGDFGALNEDSVMGSSCLGESDPEECLEHPSDHDNEDIHDAFRQDAQLVSDHWIERVGDNYRMAWELTKGAASTQHGECKFRILRVLSPDGNPPDVYYSAGSRNSEHQNGIGCQGIFDTPQFLELASPASSRCYRASTESWAFAASHPSNSRYGLKTLVDCVVKDPNSLRFWSFYADWDDQLHIRMHNPTSSINAINLKVEYLPTSTTICTGTLAAGATMECTWPSGSGLFYYVLITYNRASDNMSFSVPLIFDTGGVQ